MIAAQQAVDALQHNSNGASAAGGVCGDGILISKQALMSLPTSGAAWEHLKRDALGSWGNADLSNQDSTHNTLVLAGALYAARTGDEAMRQKTIVGIEAAMGTEDGGRTLALGRNLMAYVLAAGLAGYRTPQFESWLRSVRNETLDGRTLISTHEDRANNWGTHAGASRIAVAMYLNDQQDLARAAAGVPRLDRQPQRVCGLQIRRNVLAGGRLQPPWASTPRARREAVSALTACCQTTSAAVGAASLRKIMSGEDWRVQPCRPIS